MTKTRKKFSNEFKAKVALEAIKGYKSLVELSKEYQVHPNVIGNWKKELLEGLPDIFDHTNNNPKEENNELIEQLYKQIGKQQVELEWLKKKFHTIG